MCHTCPTTMPTQQGQRIRTDARDAIMIAQCLSYGGYHPVYIPTEEHDSVKEYLRMSDDHKLALKKVKQQINAFCLRHGYHYEKTKWTKAHLKWLKQLEVSALYRETLDEYMASYEEQTAKIERFDRWIEELASQERYQEIVKKLGGFLGIKIHTALSLIVEPVILNGLQKEIYTQHILDLHQGKDPVVMILTVWRSQKLGTGI